MAVQKQDDQQEHTFSSYVRIRDVVLKTYLGRWTSRAECAREGQGYPCYQRDMMMMMNVKAILLARTVVVLFNP